MGRKNIVYDFKPVVDEDMSQVQIIGKESIVAQHDTVTYEASWAGASAINGDISIEYSRDEQEPKTWHKLDFGTTMSLDGASGTHQLIITEIGFKFLRPVYDRTDAGAAGLLNWSIFATNKGA